MPAESSLDALRRGGLGPAVLTVFHTCVLSLSSPLQVTPFCASQRPSLQWPLHACPLAIWPESTFQPSLLHHMGAKPNYWRMPCTSPAPPGSGLKTPSPSTCLSLNPAYLSQPRFNVASSKAASGSPFPSSLNLQRRLASLCLARAIFLWFFFGSSYHLPCIFGV